MGISSYFIREQGTESVDAYRTRVYRLAAIYFGIVIIASIADIVIIWQGKFFVTLSQRSNVETMILAVILVLFLYLIAVSLPGAWGAAKIVYYNLPAWLGQDRTAVEQRKQAALTFDQAPPDPVFLNCVVRRAGSPNEPIEIPLEDPIGSLGTLIIDGAKLWHENSPQDGSNGLFAYFEQRIRQLVQAREPRTIIEIVQWASIDDEEAYQYDSMVRFSCALEKHLDAGPLWPTVELTVQDIEVLKKEASALCPILRNEAHLPDMEYEVEHRLPIIPEPLAFIALSRHERRADPEVSMGCGLIVAVVILGFLLLFLWLPPWVPGK